MMESEAEDVIGVGHHRPGDRSFSSMSLQSSVSSKFPLLTSDSGLYTCSSSNSECLESDTDCYHLRVGVAGNDEALQLALQESRRLRSELERLTKSEQWYKQELRHQKATRLDDLEKIYTQERKCMHENQRLQKECVRLYEKCSEFEKKLEKNRQELSISTVQCGHLLEVDPTMNEFEVQQQMALIKDQQMLVEVLRKQKQALLEDLRNLNENKDEKVVEMQRLLADLEIENKQTTKRCADLFKERASLEKKLQQKDATLSNALVEKLSLQKTLVEVQDRLTINENVLRLKEDEITEIQENFRHNMQNEQNLEEVHRISLKYHREIMSKSEEIKTLKNKISCLQLEMENLRDLQDQTDRQKRLIEQLKFSLETSKVELLEMRQSEEIKSTQIEEQQKETEKLMQEKVISSKEKQRLHNELEKTYQELKNAKQNYDLIQQKYKETKFKLEMLEIDHGKLQFERESDQQEIFHLRLKLTQYLQQTSELSKKMQKLELDLDTAYKAKEVRMHDFKEDQNKLEIEGNHNSSDNASRANDKYSKDFVEFSHQCERLQKNLDVILEPQMTRLLHAAFPKPEGSAMDEDLNEMFAKLQENTELLRCLLKDKEKIRMAVHLNQNQEQDVKNLVNENEILKQKIYLVEKEASILQLKDDLNDMIQKCAIKEDVYLQQRQKVEEYQKKLLANDALLYKMQRNRHGEQREGEINCLQQENIYLEKILKKEQEQKTMLNAQVEQLSLEITQLKDKLAQLKANGVHISHKTVQCDIETEAEFRELKEQVLNYQEKERHLHEVESQRKDERIQLLNKMADIQQSKIVCIQNSQRDWEDMLQSLIVVQSREEETQKELELKRKELEELNHVFGEQNEELRKLEELTLLMESKRRHDTHKLTASFQQQLREVRQQLHESQQDAKDQQAQNLELQKIIEHRRQNQQFVDEFVVDGYKTEIILLKNKVEQSESEKNDLLDRIKELEEELRDIKSHQRHAVLLPQLSPSNNKDIQECDTDVITLKSSVGEAHLRILTKVLEAEYDRKMQRYDEHIHSLLSNVRALRKSLKLNEEKTAVLENEHKRTEDQLKDLQRTKRKFEDMRFKYEQSQNTIEELKKALATERKKFESSDLGKSSQNQATTYEVSNLIDDYKKLIQQSAAVTKRPTNCAVLDLIQRSNQCVPNLHKLESNLVELRGDLHNFITSHTPKLPSSTLINAASLSVPASLMDELRAALEDY